MVFTTMCVNAQYEYKLFRVDIGLEMGPELLFSIEPKYAVFPQLSVGVRYNANFFDKFDKWFNRDFDSHYSKTTYEALQVSVDYHYAFEIFNQ